jgi:hypothetical protein
MGPGTPTGVKLTGPDTLNTSVEPATTRNAPPEHSVGEGNERQKCPFVTNSSKNADVIELLATVKVLELAAGPGMVKGAVSQVVQPDSLGR